MRPDHALNPLAEIDELLSRNAELRAAVEAWGDAHRHFRHVLAHPDQGSSEPYLWAEHEFYQAEERLLAALAATEGQS